MDIYSVKDEKEFSTKVLGSEKPVVVQFFATYVGVRVYVCTCVCMCIYIYIYKWVHAAPIIVSLWKPVC